MFGESGELAPVPQPLPVGPAWERLLFESPWPLILVLGAAAVVAFYVFRRRGRMGVGAGVAGLLLVVAAAAWGVARQVTTEREEVRAAAAELVDAAAKADVGRLDGLLDASAAAYTSQVPNGMPKGRILDEVRRLLGEEYPVKEYVIEESQAVIDGPGVARAQLLVYVVEADKGTSISMWWALDLRRDQAGTWRTTAIRPLHPLLAAGRRK